MNSDFRVVVMLSGRGSNFEALAKSLTQEATPAKIVGVVHDKKRAQGAVTAKELGIDCTHVPRRLKEISNAEYQSELADAVITYSPDLVVLAGFMRILLPEFVTRFEGKVINIHPSLLPSFKGLAAQEQAFNAGVKLSGCTVHYVTPELDSGPIIGQRSVEVQPEDTGESLAARILVEEHVLLPRVVREIALGNVALSKGKVLYKGAAEDLSVRYKSE